MMVLKTYPSRCAKRYSHPLLGWVGVGVSGLSRAHLAPALAGAADVHRGRAGRLAFAGGAMASGFGSEAAQHVLLLYVESGPPRSCDAAATILDLFLKTAVFRVVAVGGSGEDRARVG